MNHKAYFTRTVFLAAAISLGACQQAQIAEPSPFEHNVRNDVQLVRLSHTIGAEDDGTDTPSVVTYASLNAFLASVNVGAYDVLVIDAGDVADSRIRDIETHIRKRGLAYGGRTVLGAKPEAGTMMLYVERYVATPPDCGRWPREATDNVMNNTSAFLGCSTIGNLGLMVANPRDLIAGQSGGNSTGAAVGALYTPAPAGGAPVASPGNMTISVDGMQMTAPMPAPGSGGNGN